MISRVTAPARVKFWKSLSAFSLVLFYTGVFCLFATAGFLSMMTKTIRLGGMEILCNVLLCGGMAVLYVMAAIQRKYIVMPLIAFAQVGGLVWLAKVYVHSDTLANRSSRLPSQLLWLGLEGAITLTLGYMLLLVFISREGSRYFRTYAEIEMARQLHQELVPEIHRRIGDFDIYGASLPSGEVGGDLVDLVESGDEWTAYVADVSGHGVSPGVLMAMFKATVHTLIQNGCDPALLLEGAHKTLYPLKTSNMFVTAGFLQARGDRMELSLAGHPALLHFQRKTGSVCEYPPQDLPLGILPVQSFTAQTIDCRQGDIALLLTDGITEVAGQNETELGAEPIKSGLRQWADLPLPEVFRNIRELALRFGKQLDDQTMLLVRRL